MRKLSNIVLYIIIAIAVVVMGLFYFGGGSEQALSEVADADMFYVPNYTSLAINLAIGLLIIAVAAAILLAIWGFAQAPKQSMKSFLGLGLLAGVLLIAYLLSDATPIKLSGSETLFTDEFRLRLADVCIWSTWILLILTVGSIVFTYIMKLTR